MPSKTSLDELVTRAPSAAGELIRSFYALPRSKHPGIALACGISLVSSLRGEKIVSPTGLSPNMFCVALAPTGSGKSRTFNRIRDILTKCKHESRLVGKPKSGAAIHKRLSNHPHGLLLWDEFGQWLSKSQLSSYEEDIVAVLLNIYSDNGHLYTPEIAAGDQKPLSAYTPYLSVCGMSTQERFQAALTKDKIADGFLNRWLIFQDNSKLEFHPTDYTYEMTLESRREIYGYPYSQELQLKADTPSLMREIEKLIEVTRMHQESPTEKALWSRALEQFIKLCMNFSDPYGGCSDEVLTYCWDLQEYLLDELVRRCDTGIQDNRPEQVVYDKVIKLRDIIPLGQTMTANEVTRKSQYLKGPERRDIIQTLIDSGQWVKSSSRHPVTNNPIQTYTNITGLNVESYVSLNKI